MALRYRLRKAFDASVALTPRWMLRGFFKTFLTHPETAEAAGFHVYPRTFYSPFPVFEEMDWSQLKCSRQLPGINFREREALQLAEQISRFASELNAIPDERESSDGRFWFVNDAFTYFDAATLYGVLRHLKPKRYVELGCGFSSCISSRALACNAKDGAACDAVYADPEPRCDLSQILETGRVVRQSVQKLSLDLFTGLEANDVLFIDTSHVLKVQSDVARELMQIIPSLSPGVWIHFHDVFSPYDYPEDWVRNKIRLCANEQYGVECLLNGGDRYEVLLPLYLLWMEHRADLQRLFPRGRSRPQSFWIRKHH
jgi:hypothetical protein